MTKRSRQRTEDYPPVPPTPKAYWEDRTWAYNHMDEIVKAYPNRWVAVVDKKVIASGKVIAEVERVAEESTGRKEFPVVLAERGIHVYKN